MNYELYPEKGRKQNRRSVKEDSTQEPRRSAMNRNSGRTYIKGKHLLLYLSLYERGTIILVDINKTAYITYARKIAPSVENL